MLGLDAANRLLPFMLEAREDHENAKGRNHERDGASPADCGSGEGCLALMAKIYSNLGVPPQAAFLPPSPNNRPLPMPNLGWNEVKDRLKDSAMALSGAGSGRQPQPSRMQSSVVGMNYPENKAVMRK